MEEHKAVHNLEEHNNSGSNKKMRDNSDKDWGKCWDSVMVKDSLMETGYTCKMGCSVMGLLLMFDNSLTDFCLALVMG